MRRHVPLAALLSGDFEAVGRGAHALCGSGYRAVKLKVGAQDVEDDIDCARLVRRILGHDIALRLDANRAWDFATACRFVEGIDDLGIEYLEEPLASAGRLWELAVETSVPIALDETVVRAHWRSGVPGGQHLGGGRDPEADLAGWGACHDRLRIESAFKAGLKPVISACFESGVGLIALARLAAAGHVVRSAGGAGHLRLAGGRCAGGPVSRCRTECSTLAENGAFVSPRLIPAR